MAKFLILRFSSIGDIVLTTPVIRCLKNQLVDAEIHFATKKQYSLLLENNPYLSKVHCLENSDAELIQALKKEKFDYIIDLHHNLRTLRIKKSLRIQAFSFDKLNWQKWLLVNFKINRMPAIHIVDRYLATLQTFGVKNDDLGLDFFIPAKNEWQMKELLLLENLQNYAAFAIGGQHFTKKLPNEKIIEWCEQLALPVLLLGGKEDAENAELIANYFKNSNKKILNYCGKLSLHQSAAALKFADYVLSHDTGLMHIAAALKKKIISIWGNTVPEFGMYPYQTEFKIIENKGLSCRPCSKIGFKKCPKGHFNCMKELEFLDFE